MKVYRKGAITHKWAITDCQGRPKDPSFCKQQPHTAHLMSRIGIKFWKIKSTLIRCSCRQDISFQRCLYDCHAIRGHFQPLRGLYVSRSNQRLSLQPITKDGPGGWGPAILAARLITSSMVGPHLWKKIYQQHIIHDKGAALGLDII